MGAIAFGIVVSIIDEEIDRLITLKINDPEGLALFDPMEPRGAGRYHLVMDNSSGKIRN